MDGTTHTGKNSAFSNNQVGNYKKKQTHRHDPNFGKLPAAVGALEYTFR